MILGEKKVLAMPRGKRIPLYLLTVFLFWFAMYAYVPLLADSAEGLGASPAFAGIIIGAYGLTQLLLRIPLGILSDRTGKRKLFILAGMSLLLAGGATLLLSTSPVWLLFARIIYGMCACIWVTFTVLFSSYFPHEKTSQAISIVSMMNGAGVALSTLLGGLLARAWGTQATYWLSLGAGALGLLISFFIVEEKIARAPLSLKGLLAIGKNKSLLTASLLAIVMEFVNFGTFSGFTPLLARNLGAGEDVMGMLTTIGSLPNIVAPLLCAVFLHRKIGMRRCTLFSFFLLGASCILMPYAKSLPLLFTWQIVGGMGRGVLFVTLMALAIETVPPDNRATAMGFYQAIYGVGMTLGPIALGAIITTDNLAPGFWLAGLLAIVSILPALLFVRRDHALQRE